MNSNYLDFEQPIAELQEKIASLQKASANGAPDCEQEIEQLQGRSDRLTRKIYAGLTPWDVVRVARHPRRPYAMDYIGRMFSDFQELHGDRHFGDDPALVCGLGRLGGVPVAVIAQEKGRNTEQKIYRNFGMPRPEGYRKAQRIMLLAERFGLPVLTLIDTPGAYPGIDAEERGVSEAIASNLALMSRLRTPLLCAVIGEGSSGGALGIGVGDHVCMMQYATYFVISPEGCANIIWKTSEKAPEAAAAMGLTADTLLRLGMVDSVLEEPVGGAHRDHDLAGRRLSEHLQRKLQELRQTQTETLLEKRYRRLRSSGNP